VFVTPDKIKELERVLNMDMKAFMDAFLEYDYKSSNSRYTTPPKRRTAKTERKGKLMVQQPQLHCNTE